MRAIAAMIVAFAGAPASAQVFNYGDTGVLAPFGFTQQSFPVQVPGGVLGVSISATMQPTGSGTFQQDMRFVLSHPGGATFVRGPDAGGPLWNSGLSSGSFPIGPAGGQFSVSYAANLGPASGTWTVSFQNMSPFGSGSLRWTNVVVTLLGLQPGACCFPDGTCQVLTEYACGIAGGSHFRGVGTACSPPCPIESTAWVEDGDAGELPATAQSTVQSSSQTLLYDIFGTLEAPAAVDVYRIRIWDAHIFQATTQIGTGFDSQLFVFRESGLGAVANDNAPGAGATYSFVDRGANSCFPIPISTSGIYYLAITASDRDPVSAGGAIFPSGPVNQVLCVGGPGAAQPVSGWAGASSATGAYRINLVGAAFAQPPNPCYANCDNSTAAPVLNVQDFSCFLTRYAAGSPYANCDDSTAAPILNVQDFSCFLTRYAAGCP